MESATQHRASVWRLGPRISFCGTQYCTLPPCTGSSPGGMGVMRSAQGAYGRGHGGAGGPSGWSASGKHVCSFRHCLCGCVAAEPSITDSSRHTANWMDRMHERNNRHRAPCALQEAVASRGRWVRAIHSPSRSRTALPVELEMTDTGPEPGGPIPDISGGSEAARSMFGGRGYRDSQRPVCPDRCVEVDIGTSIGMLKMSKGERFLASPQQLHPEHLTHRPTIHLCDKRIWKQSGHREP